MPQTVPTVAEIKAKMAGRKETRATLSTENMALTVASRELENKVNELKNKVSDLKSKPTALRRGLDEIFQEYGVEPAEELVRLAVEKMESGIHVLDTDQRIQIWRDLLQYRMPKLRAVETKGTVDHKISITIKRFGDKARDDGKVIEMDQTE